MNAEPEPVPGEPAPLHAESPERHWRVVLLVAALLGAGLLAGIFWLGRPGGAPAAPVPDRLPPLDAAAQAYLPQIAISPVELSRWQNFLGQEVLYLDFTVANRGPRRVVALELAVEFLDPYHTVVLRERVRPVGGGRPRPGTPVTGPLAPGETRSVHAGFENLPTAWDGTPPRIRVSGLLLE